MEHGDIDTWSPSIRRAPPGIASLRWSTGWVGASTSLEHAVRCEIARRNRIKDSGLADTKASAPARHDSAFEKVDFGRYKREPPVPLAEKDVFTLIGPKGWKSVFHLLLDNCDHPDLKDDIFFQDDDFVVIYDGYPQARHHLLLLPKPSFLNVMSPSELRRAHLPRLRRLHALGTAVASHLSLAGAGEVRCGYQALTVMKPLHLHIISQDLDGDGMTKPKYWNRLTTGFFLDPCWVEEELHRRDCLDLDIRRYRLLERQTPECHLCGAKMTEATMVMDHYLAHPEVADIYGPRRSQITPPVRTHKPFLPKHGKRADMSARGRQMLSGHGSLGGYVEEGKDGRVQERHTTARARGSPTRQRGGRSFAMHRQGAPSSSRKEGWGEEIRGNSQKEASSEAWLGVKGVATDPSKDTVTKIEEDRSSLGNCTDKLLPGRTCVKEGRKRSTEGREGNNASKGTEITGDGVKGGKHGKEGCTANEDAVQGCSHNRK